MRWFSIYDENIARSYLHREMRDKCIVHCMRVIPLFRAVYYEHNNFITSDNHEDIYQELYIAIIQAIDSFDEKKDCKLQTWLFNKMDYCMMELTRQHHKRNECQIPDYYDKVVEQEDWYPIDERYCKKCKQILPIKAFYKKRNTCMKCRNSK